MRVKSTEEDTPFVILPRVLSALALVTFALLLSDNQLRSGDAGRHRS